MYSVAFKSWHNFTLDTVILKEQTIIHQWDSNLENGFSIVKLFETDCTHDLILWGHP